ncbi:hypothetical protein [Streptomyces sp. NBC_01451]|uniref:hypothetical protein n=1 Tax=Streptomyces sp. NBC_01451 TaxID=2903872 RepID=UPI002E302351|nr:hypothetical protein [Streptomyces sp. NBC_01451]
MQVDAVLELVAGLALGRDRLCAVEGLAEAEEPAVDRGHGGAAQGVALAAPYGHALVEDGVLGGLQFGGAEEVGHLAWRVEDDRKLRGRGGRRGVVRVRHDPGRSHNSVLRTWCRPLLRENGL